MNKITIELTQREIDCLSDLRKIALARSNTEFFNN